jgi:hypothetical protein
MSERGRAGYPGERLGSAGGHLHDVTAIRAIMHT